MEEVWIPNIMKRIGFSKTEGGIKSSKDVKQNGEKDKTRKIFDNQNIDGIFK